MKTTIKQIKALRLIIKESIKSFLKENNDWPEQHGIIVSNDPRGKIKALLDTVWQELGNHLSTDPSIKKSWDIMEPGEGKRELILNNLYDLAEDYVISTYQDGGDQVIDLIADKLSKEDNRDSLERMAQTSAREF